MARERQITRTINVTTATAVCMDITTMENETRALVITGDVPSQDKVLKDLRKLYDTDTFKVVAIKEMTTVEKLYGLSEVDFLKYAVELDPETRKAVTDEQ